MLEVSQTEASGTADDEVEDRPASGSPRSSTASSRPSGVNCALHVASFCTNRTRIPH
jgi:hypothetical protein